VASAPNRPAFQDSADVAFHSTVLTATATGGELVSVILKAVGEISGAPTFRVVSRFGEAYVVVFDATVHPGDGHPGVSM
jgi:hypothetical protein